MGSKIEYMKRVFNEPAPCDNCHKKYLCEEQELACRAFSGYVVTGKTYEHSAKIPSHVVFKRIFEEDDGLALTNLLRSLNAKQGEL